ncbi:Transcriptional regulator HilA [Boseongicola aestuarii]|uniref:Transcriptional regulator HilA n=2 Tax=Boseongicola aestuarii TaxID=1470561 RepID=A0A238IVV7_9RHOB|nr:Transcriptional regulator HilA [Boseongicola aestuarii]
MLAEKPGEAVSKTVFFEKVWDGAHVSEDSLVQCIAEIRRAIDDETKSIIQTIPRKGYRLVPTQSEPPIQRGFWRRIAPAMVVACLIAASYFLAAPSDKPSRVIAVLPFQDDSVEPDKGRLGDLLSGQILANLARFPELTVIARNSSFRFRDEDRDISEIAQELGANLIIEGSQQVEGSRLRVNVQLINVRNGSRVWSDQIDAEIHDLLTVSSQISSRVAHSVEAFVAEAQVKAGGSDEVDALLMNLKARRLLQSGLSKENIAGAIAIGTEAINLYPDQAWGHVIIAFALRTKLRFGWADNPEDDLEKAISHAQKAVSLAPDNYVAHFALGRVRMQQGNQTSAILAFDTALMLNPSSADTLNALAQSYFYIGQNERALEALAESARIDPLPGFIHPWMSAWTLWQDQRCDDALNNFSRIAAPPPPAHKLLAVIHVCRGEIEKASDALANFLSSEPDWTASRERELHTDQWIADGALERWIDDLTAAGLPG